MTTISQLTTLYSKKIDYLDIEIIIANSLAKTREFVLAHPEQQITAKQELAIKKLLERRLRRESIAHILGRKEFYGLDFMVNKYTLVPRPETELIVEQAIELLRSMLRNNINVIDIGTGSGCIITAITHAMEQEKSNNIKYYGSDISAEALKVAKKNAKLNGVKIKFLKSNLLSAFLNPKITKLKDNQLIITANLPYLSKEIYNSSSVDVKKYEPKSALYSPEEGLQHYRKLLEKLKQLLATCHLSLVTCFFEISPEQKVPITKLIKNILPTAQIEFSKDLAGKWRICKISI